MKKLLIVCCLLIATNTQAQKKYLFFLHNMWVEINGTEVAHPEYGKTEYNETIAKFKKEGLIVISEQRPKGTNGNVYAVKVAHQIDSLKKLGVRSSDITVAGTSKGGYITMCVSGIMKDTAINYVLIGACDEGVMNDDSVHLYGKVLSIFEESDRYQTCAKVVAKKGNDVKRFKELELHTGLKHGFLYRASYDWIKPTFEWAKGRYN